VSIPLHVFRNKKLKMFDENEFESFEKEVQLNQDDESVEETVTPKTDYVQKGKSTETVMLPRANQPQYPSISASSFDIDEYVHPNRRYENERANPRAHSNNRSHSMEYENPQKSKDYYDNTYHYTDQQHYSIRRANTAPQNEMVCCILLISVHF
jgi:hypothetical protein